jgi:hypothetical protein
MTAACHAGDFLKSKSGASPDESDGAITRTNPRDSKSEGRRLRSLYNIERQILGVRACLECDGAGHQVVLAHDVALEGFRRERVAFPSKCGRSNANSKARHGVD